MDGKEFRKQALAKRDALPENDRELHSAGICERLKEHLMGAKSVMLYNAIRSEVNLEQLVEWLWANGIATYLPVTYKGRLKAIPFSGDTEYVTGAYDIKEPLGDEADPMDIEIVLVPGSSFSRNCDRMGYGAGYYDNFLKRTDAKRIGICFEAQLYGKIPTHSNDEPLDMVVTEKQVIISKGRQQLHSAT